MSAAQGPAANWLSIGDLSTATGVAVPALRMWESRHGFPRSERRPNGHRVFAFSEVEAVRQVVAHQQSGLRLSAAIARVAAAEAPQGSVYAAVLERHPEQPRQRLRKSTLIGLSWAMEDEVLSAGRRGHLFGAFQHAANFDAARPRWTELARTSLSTHVFADFPVPADDVTTGGDAAQEMRLIPLAPDSPMHREWAVVSEAPRLTLLLTAWEVPGQDGVADLDRFFESIWTVDPAAVRTAAHTCASIAAASGSRPAHDLVTDHLDGPLSAGPDGSALTRVAHRALGYVDTFGRRQPRTGS